MRRFWPRPSSSASTSIPMTAEAVTQIVNDTINAPADAIAKAKLAIEPRPAASAGKTGE